MALHPAIPPRRHAFVPAADAVRVASAPTPALVSILWDLAHGITRSIK